LSAYFKHIAFYLTILFSIVANGQEISTDLLMKQKPIGIGTYKTTTTPGVLLLPMPFSGATFLDIAELKNIPSPARIYMIALVYTRFREADSFNQPELNRSRYDAFRAIYPGAFSQPEIEWKVLEQREATEKTAAAKCFHGFAIYLKNDPPPEIIGRDINNIKKVLDSYHDTSYWVPEKIEYKIKRREVETGKYLPSSKTKRKEGVRYSGSGFFTRKKETIIKRDSTVRKKTGGYWIKKSTFDSTIFRNTYEFHALTSRKWSPKTCVVDDVTGSMSPYSAEVMLWLKFSPQILKQGRIVFFNDGDAKPDILKRTGSTGGIHIAATDNYDSVYSVMTAAMRKGTGGDLPENYIEASLEALKRWPDTDTLLWIADNDAAVKDIVLLKDLKKPVIIMLCGVKEAVHKDYIAVAQATGGRLLIFNTEIASLKGLKNGDKFTIGGRLFEYKNGSLTRKRD
jgi:hypothetical protein